MVIENIRSIVYDRKAGVFLSKFSLAFFAFALILFSYFVFAAHVITTSSGGTSYNVNEDVGFIYNISVNNSDDGQEANITQVNITLPSGFSFNSGAQGTDAFGEFSNSTNGTTVLSWSNFTEYLVNGSSINYFWFNATAATPGNYNITITTLNETGAFSSNIGVVVNDTTDPSSITFVSPVETDGSNLSRNNIQVNVSATDSGVIDVIEIRLYNSTGLMNTSTSSAGAASYFINFTNLDDGVYQFNATVNDTFGNSNSSSGTRTVTIDTTNPSLIINSPSAFQNLSSRTITTNATFSDGGSGINYVNITIYNSTMGIVNSTTTSTSSSAVPLTVLIDGVHNINVVAYDYAGNTNTSTVNVTIDTTNPAVSIVYPTNTTYTSVVTALNYTVSDVNLQACWYNVNGTNQSITCGTNVTGLNSGQGSSTWRVYANDSLGNVNLTTSVTFFVDSINPSLSFVSPTPSSGSYVNSLTVNVTVNDTNFANVTISLYNSTNGLINSSVGTSSPHSISYSGLTNGMQYFFNATALDSLGNANNSATINVTIDTTSPVVTLIAPNNSISSTTNAYNFTFNVTENNAINICFLIVGGSVVGNSTNINVTGGTNGIYKDSIAAGTHIWSVNCTDVANNVANSSSRNFTVEATSGGNNNNTGGNTGGGGGGGGGAGNSQTWTKVTPGAAAIMKLYDADLGLKQITVEVNNPAQNVKITVTKFAGKPASVSIEKTGKVYKYFEVKTENLDGNVAKGVFEFEIPKTWLTDNKIEASSIAVFRFDGAKWNALPTSVIGTSTDGKKVIIQSTTPGFSFFAIGEVVAASAQAAQEQPSETTPPAQEEQQIAPTEEAAKGSGTNWGIMAVVLVILAIVIVGVVLMVKKNKNK